MKTVRLPYQVGGLYLSRSHLAKYRMVNTRFWDDGYIVKLDPSQKMLFLYLITNSLTNIIGIYEIPIRRIAFDTGFDEGAIANMLHKFQCDGKVVYKEGWIAVVNFEKHQTLLRGEKLKEAKSNITKDVPNSLLVACKSLCNQQSLSLSLSKSKSNTKNSDIDEVYEHYKSRVLDRTKTKRVLLTPEAKDKVKARLKTYSVQDLKESIDNFTSDRWQIDNNSGRGLAWFMHNDRRIEQNLNNEPKKIAL